MGLRIHTNVPALIAQRNLRITRNNLDHNLERLSSGLRINHAGDDAAGMANAEMLRAQLRGLSQAERNAQDGISVIQITEGSLSEVSNILIRMREIAVQAASDTIGPSERGFLNIEFQQLLEEIDRIANGTEYNHVKLLNGSSSHFEVQVGTGNNPNIDRIRLFDGSKSDVNTVALNINLTEVSNKLNAQNSLESIDIALERVNAIRAHFGAIQNRLQSTINNISIQKENISAAMSRIRDADMAEEMTELTKNQILMQAGTSILSQANSSVKSALSLLNQGGGM
jgi:flagellin